MNWYYLLEIAFAVIVVRGNDINERHDVYIAGFFPYSMHAENSAIGRGVMPSVKLALDHVNDHDSILRKYRLHMWWNDTMCNTAVGVKSFFDMMHTGPSKVMLFGAACTHVTDPIAKVSKHWHITQLSYADTHPMFTKSNFPNFFRIVPSDKAFNAPRLALLNRFNWTRVGTIYQNQPRYSLAHNRLLAELDILGYDVVESQSFTNEVHTALLKLKEKDTRIILGNFNETWAVQIFCEAFHLKLFGRKYQWIIMATYSTKWWSKIPANVNCSEEEIVISLQQTIVTDILPLSTNGEITISGITPLEYEDEYNSRRGTDYSRFHGYAYDGIWAIALAIEHVSNRLQEFRPNESVVNFRYTDPLWEQLFLQALTDTSFEGVTGSVRFYQNERKANILIKQFQDNFDVKIGEFNGVTNHLDLSLGADINWLGRYPPKDRTLVIIEHQKLNRTVLVSFSIFAILGIAMATFFLCVNIKYRNQRYIKMSSPQLNNLIIIGCILTYSSVILLGLDSVLTGVEVFPYICTARAWTLMAGFSLAFGAMFSKTWRVHSIFTDVKLNKKIIKDYQLFIVVGILLCVDLMFMLTWQISDPFFRETKQLEAHPHPKSEDTIIIPENEYCSSHKMSLFIGSIYVYKGMLMIFGAFLAWETRNVSIPALNDSRHVGLSVYNVAIMCICGAAVAFVLTDHQDAMFLIIGIFVLFCTTATLCLVFVPKLLELKRNPSGHVDKKVRTTLKPMSSTLRSSTTSNSMTNFFESKLKELKINNSHYRKLLTDKETELQSLLENFDSDDEIRHDFERYVQQQRRQQGARANAAVTPATKSTALVSISSQIHLDVPSTTSNNTSSCSLLSTAPFNSSEKNLVSIAPHPKPNAKSSNIQTPLLNVDKIDSRRSSIGQVRQHFVSRNELWNTSTVQASNSNYAHKCSHTRTHRNSATSTGTAHDAAESQTPTAPKTITAANFGQQSRPPVRHFHRSTPNMNTATTAAVTATTATAATTKTAVAVAVASLKNTSSENDLLINGEQIIPIFQKLITERQKNSSSSLRQSCPNISVRCDIVEYL